MSEPTLTDPAVTAKGIDNLVHRPSVRCSFCGKSTDCVRLMIAGPGNVHICNECVGLSSEVIASFDASADDRPLQYGVEPCILCGYPTHEACQGCPVR